MSFNFFSLKLYKLYIFSRKKLQILLDLNGLFCFYIAYNLIYFQRVKLVWWAVT